MNQDEMEATSKHETAMADDRGTKLVARSLTVAARGIPAGRSGAPGTGGLSVARRLQETPASNEPAPVWLAALMAAGCQAKSLELAHDICWRAVAGRAVYTNFGSHAENIEPLGVHLGAGETLAVSWMPGETAYTVEVQSNSEKCA